MFKLFLTILTLGLFITTTKAQITQGGPELKEVIITGNVIDEETKEPLEYATIVFFSKQQNKIVTGGITDIKGNFSIPVQTGTYDIRIEYIGFKTQTIEDKPITKDENIGNFSLALDAEALDAVEIIAERTTVEIRLDKKIYNVGKDLTVSGGTVSDVLDNVPSVSVDVEGNVSLRGNDNVRILINGKPSGLVGLNSTEALRQLPAESIEKVEVITSPSARYDAEGTAGILNIILRRSKLQGLNGSVTTNIGYPDSYGATGNVNYRTGDLNIFNNSGYRYSNSPGNSISLSEYLQTGNFLDEFRDTERIRKGLNTNFGVEWYINDSASLTTSVVYRDSNNESNTNNQLFQYDLNRVLTSKSSRIDPELEDDKTVQYSVNFTKNFEESGHNLNLEFQYEDSNENEESDVIVDDIVSENVKTLESQDRILLQADYVLPIGENTQFEAGYRGNFSDQTIDYRVSLLNDGTNDFELDTNLSNILNYREYLNAAYSQYGTKLNKFSFLFGLRLENTQLTIDQPTSGDFIKKNYTGLFPTVNLNYELSEKENITLGYSRRLRRPRSRFINPFPSRSSVTSIFTGNPDLDPSYSGTYDLGYLNRFGKVTLSTSLYYAYATDVFEFISEDTGDFYSFELAQTISGDDSNLEDLQMQYNLVPIIRRRPVNLSTNSRFGYEFNVTYSPNKKWRMNIDFNFFKTITEGDYNGDNFDNDNVSWRTRFSNKYTLPGNIEWQTTLDYRGPSETAQSKSKGMFGSNMAFSKDLFKDKASISVNVNDILNSRKRRTDTYTNTFNSYSEFQWRQRSINLSFTYRFNQKKKRQRSREDFGGDEEMIEFSGKP